MNKKSGLMLGALVLCAVALFLWVVVPRSVTAFTVMDDPPEDRALVELLDADEITRSEMHNVLAPHYNQSSYWDVARNLRLRVLASEAEVSVVGRARLDDETILTLGQLVIEDDIVVKGLLFNDSEELAAFAVVNVDLEEQDTFTLDPGGMIVIGGFVSGYAPSAPSAGCGDCQVQGKVPCCYYKPGGIPDCKCINPGDQNYTCHGGGTYATDCWLKAPKGCKVVCQPGKEACCCVDDHGKSWCHCANVGDCDLNCHGGGDGGTGAGWCEDNFSSSSFIRFILIE